jgi:DNA-binding NtrC family response regulator
MEAPLVLVADAEGAYEELLRALRGAGYAAEGCTTPARFKRVARERDVACLVCDPDGAGFDPFAEIAALAIKPALILVQGFGSVEDAVEAVQRGAFDYLLKPVADEQILVSVSRAIEQTRLRAENARLKVELHGRFELGNVVSRDAKMQRILQTVDALSDTRATILIEGESGTGKTLLARTIHERSLRAQAPFVEVNCGALPEGLLESELFGHVRGAFTGAMRDKPGKFEAADGGTIFLDEIGAASADMQVKLLRVIQDRAFERVGDTRTKTVDVRIVAATNVKLADAVADGRFREDLYYRLRVVTFELPPLRERLSDVPLLAERFLERFAREHARARKHLSPEAVSALAAHAWPGNVRELEHSLERAVLLAPHDAIIPADLGLAPHSAKSPSLEPSGPLPELAPGTTLREALEAPEREIIRQALQLCRGNRKETARMLDVNRTTLFNKMKKHNLMEFPARSE